MQERAHFQTRDHTQSAGAALRSSAFYISHLKVSTAWRLFKNFFPFSFSFSSVCSTIILVCSRGPRLCRERQGGRDLDYGGGGLRGRTRHA